MEPALRRAKPGSARSSICASSRTSTQSAIAKRVGVSQMHVSRLLRSTLQRLRDEADAPPPS